MSVTPSTLPLANAVTTWAVTGASVCGASHQQDGRPNQDAMAWRPTEGGIRVAIAVADGHGSAPHPHSDIGSRIAVEVATAEIERFLTTHAADTDLAAVEHAARTDLPSAILTLWRDKVDADRTSRMPQPAVPTGPPAPGAPAEDAAAESAGAEDGTGAAEPLLPPSAATVNPYLPYGTTVVAAGICERFLLLVQNGDGDILAVSPEGEVTTPLPEDERLFANVTTSLCLPNAERDFRVMLLPFEGQEATPPELLLLTTDGYTNSFVSGGELRRAASDCLNLLREHGLRRIGSSLESWLNDASKRGSGDDCTLVLAMRSHPGRSVRPAKGREAASRKAPAAEPASTVEPEGDAKGLARTSGDTAASLSQLEEEQQRLRRRTKRAERFGLASFALALLSLAVGTTALLGGLPPGLRHLRSEVRRMLEHGTARNPADHAAGAELDGVPGQTAAPVVPGDAVPSVPATGANAAQAPPDGGPPEAPAASAETSEPGLPPGPEPRTQPDHVTEGR